MAKNSSFLLGAIVGGIAGAAAALFLTSKRGKQLLEEAKQTNINKWQSDIKQKVSSVLDHQENEEETASVSIPIPIPNSDVEQLLKETERAVENIEKRLTQGDDEREQNRND